MVIDMFLSSLQEKVIINTIDGKKIGVIIDAEVDDLGGIKTLVVQNRKFLFFLGKKNEIKWDNIEKIGKDVILVKYDNL